MLKIQNLTYRIGGRVLLDEATASINPGHRVGLVGRNGTGKTTLLRLIFGTLDPDGGSVEYPSSWRIGMTSQEAPGGTKTLLNTVLDTDKELASLTMAAESETDGQRLSEIHTRLADIDAYSAPSRAARILAGLGFSESQQQQSCNEFSGGWRMRVALAGLLFWEPDLLLLDEPTNHLDLEATIWLEDYLRRYPGTVLLVSHDRNLLNRFAQEILHLEELGLKNYTGGYDQFEQTRRMQLEQNEKMRVKQDAQRAHIEKFVERFRYKASKAKQAQSRIKQLARMEPIPEHQGGGSVTFSFPDPIPLAPPLYRLEQVSVGYDGKAVLENLSLRLDEDDRIGLLGANGNGKSTFIKLLAGRLEALNGTVSKSGKVRVGYFAQHQTDELDGEVTPIVQMGRLRPTESDQQLRSHLGQFGFSQLRAETKISNLSGGEKARLLFSLMSVEKPHILLLDEPTNHLDIETRQALVQALGAYQGAVVIVSHDPHLIELTADRLWLVSDGRVTDFDGDLDDYRTLLLKGDRSQSDPVSGDTAKAPIVTNKKELRKLAAAKRAGLSDLRNQISTAEKQVIKLEKQKSNLQEAMADPVLYEGNSGGLVALQRQFGQLEKDLAAAEEKWISLQEQMELTEGESA